MASSGACGTATAHPCMPAHEPWALFSGKKHDCTHSMFYGGIIAPTKPLANIPACMHQTCACRPRLRSASGLGRDGHSGHVGLILPRSLSRSGPNPWQEAEPSWSKWNMIFERTMMCSLSTPYSIYFRMAVILRVHHGFSTPARTACGH